MRCLACETEKQPGSWLCPNCGTTIPKPPKPPYKAAGWEWAAGLLCSIVFAGTPAVNPIEFTNSMTGIISLVGAVAFSFSAFREQRRFAIVVGSLCLGYWTVFGLGLPLVYCAIILIIEHVRWQMRVARM